MKTDQSNRRNLEIEEALSLASDVSITNGEKNAESEVVNQESFVTAEKVVQKETTSMNSMKNLIKSMISIMKKILKEHLSDQNYNERQDAKIFDHIDVSRTQKSSGKRLEEFFVVEDHISSDEKFSTHITLIRSHVDLDTKKIAVLKLSDRFKALSKSSRFDTSASKISAKVTFKISAKIMSEFSTKVAFSIKKLTVNALVSKRKQAKNAEIAKKEDLDSNNERRKKIKSTIKNISFSETMLKSSKAQIAQTELEMNARHQQVDKELKKRRRQHQSNAKKRRLMTKADRLRRKQHHELLMQQNKERELQLELQLITLRADDRDDDRSSDDFVNQNSDQNF